MSYVKYTKTATFLFPLVEVPKVIFDCEVRNNFDKLIMASRFLNAYMWDKDLEFEFNHEPYVFVVVKPFRDVNFEEFHSTIISMENYVDEYEKDNFIVMIFKIPENNLDYYNIVMQGKYSQIPSKGKAKVLKNSYFSGKIKTVVQILNKGAGLKKSWEDALSAPHPDPRIDSSVCLGDQELWSKILYENEGLSTEELQSISKSSKIIPQEEFKD